MATAISYEPIAGCFYNGDDPLQLMRQVPEPAGISTSNRVSPSHLSRISIPMLAICACGPFRLAIATKLPASFGWCRIRYRSSAFRRKRFLPPGTRRTRRPVPDPQSYRGAMRIAARAGSNGTISPVASAPRRAWRKTPCVTGSSCIWLISVGRAALWRWRSTMPDPCCPRLKRHLLPSPVTPVNRGRRRRRPTKYHGSQRLRKTGRSRAPRQRGENRGPRQFGGRTRRRKKCLAYSAEQVEQNLGSSEVARSIQRDRDAIERLVTELHGTVLQLRMVPVAQLFGSFPRLIRDIARQLDKKVALVTHGETTEVDKTIMDRLFEPMVHLVRNALDHGVENPEQRRAAGKTEAATISIAASRSGDRLVVEVTDDGRGIDPAVVRRKASEKRYIASPMNWPLLTDEAVVDLVFSAGFSTASAVSDISGRGIGMDVVRAAIEQIGGRVSLESKVGIGTTVRLDLPMTIAMSRIMVVETGGQLFGIAMDAVSETVRVTPDRISTIKNNDGFVLRDRVVPIISLAELMKLPEQKRDVCEARLLVVMEAAGRIAAFEIDAIRDRLDVVLKPMQGLLAGARGYAGTTLLGNGQVLLVLDMKEILP